MVRVFSVPNYCVRNKQEELFTQVMNLFYILLCFRLTELSLHGRVLVERKVMESIPACSKTDLLLAE